MAATGRPDGSGRVEVNKNRLSSWLKTPGCRPISGARVPLTEIIADFSPVVPLYAGDYAIGDIGGAWLLVRGPETESSLVDVQHAVCTGAGRHRQQGVNMALRRCSVTRAF